jgi:chromosome segregation ATPase
MEGELRMLRETTKHLHQGEPDLEQQLKDSQNKYDELLHVYRRGEERARRDERDLKAGRDRIRELEDLLAEIIDKANKLPASTKELKYCTSALT